MANPDHVAVVHQGGDALDGWHRRNSGERLDLSGATLSKLDLREANFSGANLSGADLSGSNLTEASLRRADLITATLQGANLSEATLTEANLTRADLRQAILVTANLTQANLTDANLYRADLLRADLVAANLTQASLRRADLTEANLAEADLQQADLHRANLAGANLSRAQLSAANLTRANLSGANLYEVEFMRAISAFTIFIACDFSRCNGLESVQHRYPSTVDSTSLARTLRGAGGALTEAQNDFFRHAGTPKSLLDALSGLVDGDKLHYLSCYIAYAPADAEFAAGLSRDLAAQGVHCWLYDEQDISGRGAGANIERALSVYDKLIVVASASSLTNSSLLRKLQRALQKEETLRSQGAADANVLFLARRDDYATTEWSHARKEELMAKHIADFRSPSNYSDELARLAEAMAT